MKAWKVPIEWSPVTMNITLSKSLADLCHREIFKIAWSCKFVWLLCDFKHPTYLHMKNIENDDSSVCIFTIFLILLLLLFLNNSRKHLTLLKNAFITFVLELYSNSGIYTIYTWTWLKLALSIEWNKVFPVGFCGTDCEGRIWSMWDFQLWSLLGVAQLTTFWGAFYFRETEIWEVEKCLKGNLSQCLKVVQL